MFFFFKCLLLILVSFGRQLFSRGFIIVAVAAVSIKCKLSYRLNFSFLIIIVMPPVANRTKKTTRLLLGQNMHIFGMEGDPV